MMRAFCAALQFLTVLPTCCCKTTPLSESRHALVFFPLVGALIGVILLAFAHLPVPDALRAAIVVVVWVAITGGIHCDGLADSADAWACAANGGDRVKILAVMKDPTCGPAGVVALIAVLLLKYAAVQSLLSFSLLLLPPLLGRSMVVLLIAVTPVARSEGLGATVAAGPHKLSVTLSLGLSLLFSIFFGWPGVLAFFAALFTFFILRRSMMKRIQGFTGDTCGALVELIETVALIALASFAA